MWSVESTEEQSLGLKPYEPETLSPLHKNVLALMAAGMRAREICKIPGMPSESRISVVKNSPAGQAFLKQASVEISQRISEDAREIIKSHAVEAANTVIQLMRGAENEGVRLRASQDLLDRSGLKPVENHRVMHIAVEQDDVDRLVAALHESRTDVPEFEEIEDSAAVFEDESDFLVLD